MLRVGGLEGRGVGGWVSGKGGGCGDASNTHAGTRCIVSKENWEGHGRGPKGQHLKKIQQHQEQCVGGLPWGRAGEGGVGGGGAGQHTSSTDSDRAKDSVCLGCRGALRPL